MRLRFTKMHGAGNDFVVLDALREPIRLTPTQLRLLADRHLGVGADQILQVEPPDGSDVDFVYRIFNADGGEVEQCGNGARCFARYVADRGLAPGDAIRVRTLGGVIVPRLESDGRVTVNMGAPIFDPLRVPFDPAGLSADTVGRDTVWRLPVGDGLCRVSVLSMGNPHAVLVVADVDNAPVARDGPLIEHHLAFPRRVNAGFMQVLGRNRIALRVFERGAGETLACGSGACAAVVAGVRRGLLDPRVDVSTRGGVLTIAWSPDLPAAPVMMTGPARQVFEGEIDLPD